MAMIDSDTAGREVLAASIPLSAQPVAIADAAGRALAESVTAERDQPPFDRVTMDGIAVRAETGRQRWTLLERSFAGDPPTALGARDGAIEVMTGAVLPEGTDTVIPSERYTVRESGELGTIELESGYTAERGQFIHPRGSDHAAREVVLEPGILIGPAEVAILASAGLTEVQCVRMPRVAIVATGNELVPAGDPIEAHEVRLSNAPALLSAVQASGASGAWWHLPDDPAVLERELESLIATYDVVLLSGGVSRGRADFVPTVLEHLGVQRHFHRVAQRPGKPLWFGATADNTLVFGLPGNPVSTLACFCRYVRPALHVLRGLGQPTIPTVRLASDWEFKLPLTALVPAIVQPDDQGQQWAALLPTNTSGDFTALAGAHGFVELPAAGNRFAAADSWPFYPIS